MPRLNDHFTCPEEDWTGLKDAKARRKLQNRLNVRAHRKRKAEQSKPEDAQVLDLYQDETKTLLQAFHSNSPLVDPSVSWSSAPDRKTSMDPETYARSSEWNTFARMSFSARVRFPLSSDHLLSLAQYNLVRASTTNAIILSLHHLIPAEHCGIDFENMPLFPPSNSSFEIPQSLKPTRMQLETPHEFWVDLVPDPQLRDNVLLALSQGKLDTAEFQGDLVGYICKEARKSSQSPFGSATKPEIPFAMAARWQGSPGGCSLSEQRELGILVWSDPWSIEGYEVTPAFLHKWRFLFKGCHNMLDATNHWRERRGEEPLVLEL